MPLSHVAGASVVGQIEAGWALCLRKKPALRSQQDSSTAHTVVDFKSCIRVTGVSEILGAQYGAFLVPPCCLQPKTTPDVEF